MSENMNHGGENSWIHLSQSYFYLGERDFLFEPLDVPFLKTLSYEVPTWVLFLTCWHFEYLFLSLSALFSHTHVAMRSMWTGPAKGANDPMKSCPVHLEAEVWGLEIAHTVQEMTHGVLDVTAHVVAATPPSTGLVSCLPEATEGQWAENIYNALYTSPSRGLLASSTRNRPTEGIMGKPPTQCYREQD